MEFVVTGSEVPNELDAVISKEYNVPFFNPVITAGLLVKLFSAPVLLFLTV
jgi:hypothetical protein